MYLIMVLGMCQETTVSPVQFQAFAWYMSYDDVRALVAEKEWTVLKEKAPKKRRFGGHGDLKVSLDAGEGLVFHISFSFDEKGLKQVFLVDHSEYRKDRDIHARYAQLRQQMIDKGWRVEDQPKIEDIFDNLVAEDDGGRLEMREERMPLEVKSTITLRYKRLKAPHRLKGVEL